MRLTVGQHLCRSICDKLLAAVRQVSAVFGESFIRIIISGRQRCWQERHYAAVAKGHNMSGFGKSTLIQAIVVFSSWGL